MQTDIQSVAAFYMSEGHFTVSKFERANGKWQFAAEIGFSNSDPALVDYICSWLESIDAHHYINQNASGCYQLKVQRYGDIIKVLDVIESLLFGNKKAEAALVRRFATRRLKMVEQNNAARTYTQEDHDIVEAKRQLKQESSETLRVPDCIAKHYTGSKLTMRSGQPLRFNEETHTWEAILSDDIVRSNGKSVS